jgi:hypothetical protein
VQRSCLLLALALSASAVEYTFTTGQIATYLVETKQTVAWDSAGDHLTFTSTLATNQAWRCVAVTNGTAQVEATILRVSATQSGPGSEHRMNSAQREGTDDPLLGHLAALEGVTLRLSIDQATGATTVTGGARIIAAIAKRAPNPTDPTGPSPLATQAREAYSDATLSRTWSQTLALPTAAPTPLPLGEPLTGSLLRTWTADRWTLSGDVGGTALLAKDPSPVTATVSQAGGEGRLVVGADGWPKVASGTLTFTLAVNALTQPVSQQHRIQWQLARSGP